MKNSLQFLLVAMLAFASSFTLTAAEEGAKQKRKAVSSADRILKRFDSVTLTEDQTAQIKALAGELDAKVAGLREKAALTEEQRNAQRSTVQQLKEAGKSPKEIKEAVTAAVELTEEQKAAQAEIKKATSEMNKAVTALLTPEQKEAMRGKRKPKEKTEADSQS